MRNKLLSWALVLFLLFFAWKNPHGAAHLVHQGIGVLGAAADGLGVFVTDLGN